MKKLIIVATCLAAAMCMAAGDLPQVAVLDWTDSLDITDVGGAAASLNYACVIDSKVNGSVPAHDSAYDSWRMEFVVSFDHAIKEQGDVTLYGQIHSNNGAWTLINWFTNDKKNNYWHPVHLPATVAGTSTELISTMLNPSSAENAYAVYYNTFSFSKPYGISFVDWIGEFYCGIAFHSREYLGTTCTIDVVLINPANDNDRRTLATIKYRYDEGKYGDDSPGRWFNARVGWYDKPSDSATFADNCTVTNTQGALELERPGRLSCDGGIVVDVAEPTRGVGRYPTTVKRLVAVLEAGTVGVHPSFSNALEHVLQTCPSAYQHTALCTVYADESGVTNLAGLVKMGTTNAIVRLNATAEVDFTQQLTCAMTIYDYADDLAYVAYEVNGVPFTYERRRNIPVVKSGVDNRYGVAGSAIVTDLYGDAERLPTGDRVEFK